MIEESSSGLNPANIGSIDGFESDVVVKHLRMLCKANLIEKDHGSNLYDLTWEGYDYLDLSRTEEFYCNLSDAVSPHKA